MVTAQRSGSRHRQRARWTRARLAVAAIAAAVLVAGLTYALQRGGPAPGPRAAPAPPSRPGTPSPSAPRGPVWQTVWTAGFGGPAGAGVSHQVWKFDTGTGVFGTQEVETMTDSAANVHVDGQDGLDITVLGQGQGSPGAAWTSGRIQTRQLFTPPPGGQLLVTASIRQPDPARGLGYWPAFWMLGPGAWPENGEIDILEDEDALSTHSGTFHCGNLTQRNRDGTSGPCHEGDGLGSGRLPCPGCQAGFHTYSVIIDRGDEADQQIRWYLDGREFYSVIESQVGEAAWSTAVDHGFTIILSVAVGGSYPDIVCRCVSPDGQTSSGGTMTVRNLAVYESSPPA